MHNRCRWLALASLMSCLFLVQSFPQTTAVISGMVKDESGAVLPGATVLATNVETGIARTVLSDDGGRYYVPNLQVGNYEVSGSLEGFQTFVRSGISLTVGREAVVDLTLKVGQISDKVTVTGEAPLVETTRAEVASLVERTQMSELPLNSRDFSQLIGLQSGVVQVRGGGGDVQSGFGTRLSVNGLRTSANVFKLEGTDVNTSLGQLPSNVAGASLGVDSIREFSVMKSSYSAQYGRAAGANIVAISKSGTNAFHGSLFEYLRNDNLDARNFFDPTKPEFKRNQFGGSIGGPIVRDRTFFFGSYEGLRETFGRTGIARVPTADARQGIFPTGGNVVVSNVVKPYLDLYPLPNGRNFGDGTAEYLRSFGEPTTQDYWTVRVDHQLFTKHSMFARVTVDSSERNIPQTLGLYSNESTSKNRYGTIELTSTLSTSLMNKVRFGVNRSADSSILIPLRTIDPALSFVAGRPFGGITPGSSLTGLSGYSELEPRSNFITVPQFYEELDYVKGRNTIKAGMMIERFIFYKNSFSRLGGIWTFGNLRAFLGATPQRLRIQGPDSVTDPFRTTFQTFFAWYFQDDIKLTPRLTLNFGMRHELTTVPTEKHGRLANLRSLSDAATTVGDPFYINPTLDNIAPRIGFAWDPSGSGQMSIRGGFGVFYEPVLMKQYALALDRQPPFWTELDPAPANLVGAFPRISVAKLEELSKERQAIHSLDYHLKSPYALQYSLDIQRGLPGNTVVSVNYTGTRGVHLASRHHWQFPVPQFLPDGRVFFPASAGLINPNFGRNFHNSTGGSSNYHGAKIGLQRRFTQGFQYQVNYTFSRSLDTQSGSIAGEIGSTSVLNPFDQQADYGLSDADVRHSLSTNYTLELPFRYAGQYGSSVSEKLTTVLFRGWQVSGIVSLATGSPSSLSSASTLTHPLVLDGGRPDLKPGGNNSPVLGGPDLYYDPSQFLPQQTGFFGNLGRNTLVGPGLISADLGLMKNFPVGGEGQKIQFRAEFFNLPNRVNFNDPATNLFDSQARAIASAGRITSTVTTGRQIQFALRLDF